jgi:hypothetical protein
MVSFTSWLLSPGERAPDTHWIGVWVDPRASLDATEKRKFFLNLTMAVHIQIIVTASCFNILAEYFCIHIKCELYFLTGFDK